MNFDKIKIASEYFRKYGCKVKDGTNIMIDGEMIAIGKFKTYKAPMERQEVKNLIKLTKRSKFGNKKVYLDGYKFDSEKEADRYLELKLLLKAGKIEDLILQPKFKLLSKFKDNVGKRHRAINYFADFKYKHGNLIFIEDVKSKGTLTAVYRIKKKLLLKQLPEGYIFIELLY